MIYSFNKMWFSTDSIKSDEKWRKALSNISLNGSTGLLFSLTTLITSASSSFALCGSGSHALSCSAKWIKHLKANDVNLLQDLYAC